MNRLPFIHMLGKEGVGLTWFFVLLLKMRGSHGLVLVAAIESSPVDGAEIGLETFVAHVAFRLGRFSWKLLGPHGRACQQDATEDARVARPGAGCRH